MTRTLRPFHYLLSFLLIIWVVHLVNTVSGGWLLKFGLEPRNLRALDGIVAGPFLHGSFRHLLSNTAGLVVLGALVTLHSTSAFLRVSVFVIIVGGLATWMFARTGNHIGASGLVFGYFGYLLARGIIERTAKDILIAALVALLYSGLLWGVLPTQRGVSWEGHLFGFLAGILAARWRVHVNQTNS